MKKAFFVIKIVLFLACYCSITAYSIAQNLINLFNDTAESGIWYDVVGTVESTEPQFVDTSNEFLIRESYKSLTVQPAIFIDSPGSGTIEYTDLEVVGVQWAFVTEQILVHSASIRWGKCSNNPNLWLKSGNPAQYQTILRQVVFTPEHVIKVVKTITDKQISTPASIIEHKNASMYRVYYFSLLISPATLTGTITSYSTTTQTCSGSY